MARCEGDLGVVALQRGDLHRAERCLDEARASWEQIGHEPYLGWVLAQLGRVTTLDPGRRRETARLHAESLDIARRHGLAPLALEVLVGAIDAGIVQSSDDAESVLRLVAGHPGAAFDVRSRAAALLANEAPPSPDVPPPRPGREQLWEPVAVVERLLADDLQSGAVL